MPHQRTSLYDILSNSLILLEICPLLPLTAILALTCTSKSLYELFSATPQVYRRVDLSLIRYRRGKPPREVEVRLMYKTIFDPEIRKAEDRQTSLCLAQLLAQNKLQYIWTLILDGLPVPSLLLRDVICQEHYNVRILSLRGVTNKAHEDIGRYINRIIQPSRGKPRLKGLYVFGPTQAWCNKWARPESHHTAHPTTGILSSLGAQLGSADPHPTYYSPTNIHWYDGNGRMDLPGLHLHSDFEIDLCQKLLHACADTIAFDIVSCRNCQVRVNDEAAVPRLAVVSLKGCKICGSCPEGPAVIGTSPTWHLPLLAPIPLHSSSLRAAQSPPSEGSHIPKLIARCIECLKDRWCRKCNAWWCESCYTPPRGALGKFQGSRESQGDGTIKVHNELCVAHCLVSELYSGAGEGGMWG